VATIERLQTSDCSNPILDVFFSLAGSPIDIAALEFQIFERVTSPPALVQVYPPSGRQTVNLADCPGGHKVGTGHYVAEWTVDAGEPVGTHVLKWFYKQTLASPEREFQEEFEVLDVATPSTSDGYTTIAVLRAMGVPSTGPGAKSDAELDLLITQQSRLIDLYTGRWFEPRSLVLLLDGTGRRGLLLGSPIISISQIRLIATNSSTDLPVDLGDVRIYNRHLDGLLDPDDRENPRVEFQEYDQRWETLPFGGDLGGIFSPTRWPTGTQNVEITGVFGYTEADGSPTGQTPGPIATACALMVIRNLAGPLSSDAFDAANAWRVTELKTRDQSIKWADPSRLGSRGIGAFTGDPQIDTILMAYVRPPQLGAV